MKTVSLAEARAHLSELVQLAANGKAVCITRRATPIATLTAVYRPRKPLDLEALRALPATMPVNRKAPESLRGVCATRPALPSAC